MAMKSSKAGRITKNSSKASSLKSKKLLPLIPLKSIPKNKGIKSKHVAFKQGKAVPMRSKSQKTNMNSK